MSGKKDGETARRPFERRALIWMLAAGAWVVEVVKIRAGATAFAVLPER